MVAMNREIPLYHIKEMIMNFSNVVEMDAFSKKEMEKNLFASIRAACDSLSEIENMGADLGLEISDDARDMLDALEASLRVLNS